MIRRKLTSLVAVALLAACGGDKAEDHAQAYRDALPKASSVRIDTPAASTGGAAATAAASMGGSVASSDPLYQSEYAVMSYWTAVTVNLGVWWTLNLVHAITLYPPTRCDASSCTWGPWLADDHLNFWKLHVARDGAAYDYALSAQTAASATAPWVDLIVGTVTPAGRDHGRGSFVLDFDAQDQLQHEAAWVKRDHGQLRVQHDDTAGLVVQAAFVNALNQDPQRPHPMNAVYRFDETAADGDLQIEFEDLSTHELFALRTRWKRDSGAGRADARYDGSVAQQPVTYEATQCWAGATYLWAETYDTTTDPVSGSAASCVYDTRPDPLLTVALP